MLVKAFMLMDAESVEMMLEQGIVKCNPRWFDSIHARCRMELFTDLDEANAAAHVYNSTKPDKEPYLIPVLVGGVRIDLNSLEEVL